MIHIPKAGATGVPVEVTLYDATGSPMTGQASYLSMSLFSMDADARYDFATGELQADPAALEAPMIGMTALLHRPHCYRVAEPNLGATAPRGHYKAVVTHLHDGKQDEYDVDFSLGLYSRFTLGFSAVYTPGTGAGAGLKLTLWPEEDGKIATDIVELRNVQVRDKGGSVLSGGNVGTVAVAEGLANVQAPVALAANAQYVVAADIMLPTSAGPRAAKAWVGIARP